MGGEREDLAHWMRGTGLEIVLVVLGALLLARFVRWLAMRTEARRSDRMQRLQDVGIAPSTEVRHSAALAQVIEWLAVGTIYFTAILLILDRADVPLAGILPTATIVGVALGVGAQRVVQDLLAGVFLISERQLGVGDVIRIGEVGSTAGVGGTVEAVTLRTTRLRTVAGEVVVIPNGEIRQLTNLSRDWSRVVVDVKLPVDEDLERAIVGMRAVAADLAADPEWQATLLGEPTVLGVETLDLAFAEVRVTARTQPGEQFAVGRELRQRIATRLRELDISLPSTIVMR